MKRHYLPALVLVLLTATACQPERTENAATDQTPPDRGIARLSAQIDDLIPSDARIEVLGEGYQWSEGPVWVEAESMLLFSDVPANTVYRWTAENGVEPYLQPSGYTGDAQPAREGANGLALDLEGRLLLCQHGDRRVARMSAPLSAPQASYETVADNYKGQRFNSPNDLAVHSSGAVYFTDPPYGLPGQDESPDKELAYNGVFRIAPDGEVQLLEDRLSRPNGIAFSPDEKTLYLANSDPDKAIWMAYDVTATGTIENGRVFFDATTMVPDRPGLPDGMKVDNAGVIYATGPGGVLIISDDGEHLGTIKTGAATANVAFNHDQSALYMTAHKQLLRVRLN